jgi:uncharacterized protein (TIGR03084 family)
MGVAMNAGKDTARDPAKTSVLQTVVADLAGEGHSLMDTLARLDAADWDHQTPADGWTIRDQITHLAFFDDATLLALSDPEAFVEQRAELLALGDGFPDAVADRYRGLPGERCLAWFVRSRTALLHAYRDADPAVRLPWFGPDMGPTSSATGRLMETWAHGQDVADTIAEVREPSRRLRHVADLGVRTFAFSFQLRGRAVPSTPVRVELSGPGDARWAWGPPHAEDLVQGTAMDFCLVVTQRRNVADTGLQVVGPVATAWISLAQAYAGAPGNGRPAGQGQRS